MASGYKPFNSADERLEVVWLVQDGNGVIPAFGAARGIAGLEKERYAKLFQSFGDKPDRFAVKIKVEHSSADSSVAHGHLDNP